MEPAPSGEPSVGNETAGTTSAEPGVSIDGSTGDTDGSAAAVGGASGPALNEDGDIEDWDGTVLSSSFMAKAPKKTYHLHNDATGQDIELDRSTLLGRHVSATIPEGAVSVKLIDPTRTVSRNHAAISFDKDGTLWIEDYGSLNGTYVIVDEHETQVKGKPVRIEPPVTLRIGDQFFQLSE